MTAFNPGDPVLIPCEVGAGPFPNEKLVTISQEEKVLSGFVPSRFIEEKDGKSFIRAEVIRRESDAIWVRIPGSFFTAAHGRTFFPHTWAKKHLQHIAA